MRFSIAPLLLEQLRAMQALRGYTDDVIEENDVYLLDPGLGPAFYLTADGRVLVDMRDWDRGPIREATETESPTGPRRDTIVSAVFMGPLTC